MTKDAFHWYFRRNRSCDERYRWYDDLRDQSDDPFAIAILVIKDDQASCSMTKSTPKLDRSAIYITMVWVAH